MTTKITIDAHAGWPVLVQKFGPASGIPETVEAKTIKDVYVHSGCQILLTEVQKDETDPGAQEHIMQFFAWDHLPPHLQSVSAPFALTAKNIIATLPRNPERTVALRKLLEAKDAAVRAMVAGVY